MIPFYIRLSWRQMLISFLNYCAIKILRCVSQQYEDKEYLFHYEIIFLDGLLLFICTNSKQKLSRFFCLSLLFYFLLFCNEFCLLNSAVFYL